MFIELNLIAVPELQGEPEDIAKEECKIAAQSVIIPSCLCKDYCGTSHICIQWDPLNKDTLTGDSHFKEVVL